MRRVLPKILVLFLEFLEAGSFLVEPSIHVPSMLVSFLFLLFVIIRSFFVLVTSTCAGCSNLGNTLLCALKFFELYPTIPNGLRVAMLKP